MCVYMQEAGLITTEPFLVLCRKNCYQMYKTAAIIHVNDIRLMYDVKITITSYKYNYYLIRAVFYHTKPELFYKSIRGLKAG